MNKQTEYLVQGKGWWGNREGALAAISGGEGGGCFRVLPMAVGRDSVTVQGRVVGQQQQRGGGIVCMAGVYRRGRGGLQCIGTMAMEKERACTRACGAHGCVGCGLDSTRRVCA